MLLFWLEAGKKYEYGYHQNVFDLLKIVEVAHTQRPWLIIKSNIYKLKKNLQDPGEPTITNDFVK